jgi:hypothetical protein
MDVVNLDTTPKAATPEPKSTSISSPDKPSPISDTYQGANRLSKAERVQPISAETGNFIMQSINRIAEQARLIKDTDLEAFNKNPTYAQVLQIQDAHPDLFIAADIPKPEKKEEVKKTEKKKDDHGRGDESSEEQAAPEKIEKKAPQFDITRLSLQERTILEGTLRLIAQDLAAAEGVDFIDENLPIKVQEAHHDHWTDRIKVAIDTVRFSISTKPETGDYDLLDEHGHPARTGATEESLASQFIRLENKRSSPYARAIRFEEIEKPIDRLREIATMHNASIALRESYTGQKAWKALGEVNDKFDQDNLSISIKHQIDKLVAARQPGKTHDQLVDANGQHSKEYYEIKREAIKNAIVEMGGNVREVYNRQVGNERDVNTDAIANARTRADETRGKTTEKTVYKKAGTVVSEREYQEQELKVRTAQNKVTSKEKEIAGYQTQLDESQKDLTELTGKRSKDEKDLVEAKLQETSFALKHLITDKIARQEYIDKNAVPTIITDEKGATREVRDKTAVLAALKELDNRYQAVLDRISTAQSHINLIDKELPKLIKDMEDKIEKAEGEKITLNEKLTKEKEITLSSEQTMQLDPQSEMTDFITGKAGNEKTPEGIYSNRTNHVMEVFLAESDEVRNRTVESYDNFRNVIFGVEGDIAGQEMAKKVLPDNVLVSSLLQAMNISDAEVQDWLGPQYGQGPLYKQGFFKDGVINVSKRYRATYEYIMGEIQQNILWRLQHNTALTNATIGRMVLRERLFAASTEDGLNKLSSLKVQKITRTPLPGAPLPAAPARTPAPAAPTPPPIPTPPVTPPPGVPPTPGAIPPSPGRPGRNRFLFPNRPPAATGTGGGTP